MAGIVPVLCHYGGRIVLVENRVEYEGGNLEGLEISKTSTYCDLLKKLYEVTGWDENECNITMKCKFPTNGIHYAALDIKNDVTTRMMFDLYPRVYAIELLVERSNVHAPKIEDFDGIAEWTALKTGDDHVVSLPNEGIPGGQPIDVVAGAPTVENLAAKLPSNINTRYLYVVSLRRLQDE